MMRGVGVPEEVVVVLEVSVVELVVVGAGWVSITNFVRRYPRPLRPTAAMSALTWETRPVRNRPYCATLSLPSTSTTHAMLEPSDDCWVLEATSVEALSVPIPGIQDSTVSLAVFTLISPSTNSGAVAAGGAPGAVGTA